MRFDVFPKTNTLVLIKTKELSGVSQDVVAGKVYSSKDAPDTLRRDDSPHVVSYDGGILTFDEFEQIKQEWNKMQELRLTS